MNYEVISTKAGIKAFFGKNGRELRVPMCPEPIVLDDPHVVIDINEKPIREPGLNEIYDIINNIKVEGIANSKTFVKELESERNALIDFYKCANGKQWYRQDNWCDTDAPLSIWYGVTVKSEVIISIGGRAHAIVGHVVRLDLSHNNMFGGYLQTNGYISPEIEKLTRLEFLNLSRNFLEKTIPVQLYNLTELRELYLHFNQLEGGISTNIKKLKKLEKLQLDHNHLTGPIPSQIGDLKNLKVLCLHVNNLDNGLARSLPKPIATGNSTVEGVKIDSTKSPGLRIVAIPNSIGTLPELEILLLYNNQLSGEIPSTIKNNPKYLTDKDGNETGDWQVRIQQDNKKLS